MRQPWKQIKNNEKPLENHGNKSQKHLTIIRKTEETRWQTMGKNIGNPWENHEKHIGKPLDNHQTTMGKT